MDNFLKKVIEKSDNLPKNELLNLLSNLYNEFSEIETIFESFNFSIIIVNTDLVVTKFNKLAKRLFSLIKVDKNILDIIAEDEIKQYINYTINSQEKYLPRIITLKKNEKKIYYKVSIFPIVKDGSICGYIFSSEDITDDCNCSADSVIINKLSGMIQLTANVAHEIKNPLASISIYLQLIKRITNSKKVDVNEIDKYVSIISEEVERLSNFLSDFSIVVKPINVKKDLIDFDEFLQDIVLQYKPLLDSENILINYNSEKKLPKVECNKDALKQVFVNLLNNSINAKKSENAHIDISMKLIENRLAVRIYDNGKGISHENLNKIFDPYFSTSAKGTGLGLSIVYKIIKDHQGEIVIDSKEGEGTEFLILLPFKSTNCKLLRSDNE